MITNMTGFEITEVSGHTAAVGHTQALGNAQDHRDTDGDLGHGVFIGTVNNRTTLSLVIMVHIYMKRNMMIAHRYKLCSALVLDKQAVHQPERTLQIIVYNL